MSLLLVTGGCGFIGSHLVKSLLDDGHSVRVLDNLSAGQLENVSSKVDVHVGSVTDLKTVYKVMDGVDACYHLAAIASVEKAARDWVGAHRVNLTGTINVFEAAGRQSNGPVPVVYASSAAIYGAFSGKPSSEDEKPCPMTSYGADKLGCEQYARIAAIMYGAPNLGLRLFNVYGPNQDPRSISCGVIPIFAQNILDRVPLLIYGDGKQVRDFIFVSDAVKFIRNAMERVNLDALSLNVCSGVGIPIIELADILRLVTGIDPVIQYKSPRVGETRNSVGDTMAAQKILGLQSEVSLISGLEQTVDWLEYAAARHG
ncbi:MAG: NAD-dependent epimerase/dehydratase family protein [Rhodospirillales bacterium]|nr:NAD-dependent epimerase/dehydratase family protein [Rhodospirillales bacterium]MBT8002107.1 NAD-dependent epimerase/dehydratase family protein [Rhodospirillales bacterium]